MTITREISLSCRWGTMKGTARSVDPDRGLRIACYCDDCQAYAHDVDQANSVLDAWGGTDLFHLTPAQNVITAGREQLQCLRLTTKGMMRWTAGCCRTPVANTLQWAGAPFAGIVHFFMDHDADGQSRDEALGPVVLRVQGRFGIGALPTDIDQEIPISCVERVLMNLGRGWVKRLSRPSPFFDAQSRFPVVEPRVLSTEEREHLRPLCGPRSTN